VKSPYQLLANIITKRPALIAGLVACVFFISLYGMTMTTMETGTDTYVDKNSAQGILLNSYTETFKSDVIMVIYEADNILDIDVINYINQMQGEFARQNGVKGTNSVIDLLKQLNGGALPASKADIERLKKMVPPETLEKYLPSNMMTIGILSMDTGMTMDTEHTLLNNLQTNIDLSDKPAGIYVTLSGNPAFQKEMGEEIGQSTGVLILSAMLLMIVAVGLLFSHVSHRFLPVGVVFTGLVMTFGIMGLTGISLSMVVIAAFPVLIGIGIDYAIQFHARFDDEMKMGLSVNEAVKITIQNSGPSILHAMIATSLGFIAMWISPLPMVVDFGLTCLIGVVCCYIAALLIIPTFGILIKYKPKESIEETAKSRMETYDTFLGNLALKMAKNPVIVIVILGMVAVVGIQLDGLVPISSDEETFVPPDMPAVISLNKVKSTMGSTDTLTVYVRGDGVIEPESLEWIDDFGRYEVKAHNDVLSVKSIATYLKEYNGGTLPKTESEVKTVLELIPDGIKQEYVSGNMNAVIEFGLAPLELKSADSLLKQVKDELKWNYPPPGIDAKVTGQYELMISLLDEIAKCKTQMTFIGFGLIFAWLLFVYRKLSAISPLIPIMMIVGWNGAIMYIFCIDYTPMTAVLGSMTIGVASEYTILIMERYNEERNNGADMYDAIQTGVQKVGTAITVSGLTTVFGFSALMLSSFNIIQNFGMVTVITVGFSLIGSIIVMPAIISLMGRFHVA